MKYANNSGESNRTWSDSLIPTEAILLAQGNMLITMGRAIDHETNSWSYRTILEQGSIISTRKYTNNSEEQSHCGDPKAIISSRTYANNPENNIVIERRIDWNADQDVYNDEDAHSKMIRQHLRVIRRPHREAITTNVYHNHSWYVNTWESWGERLENEVTIPQLGLASEWGVIPLGYYY